MVKVNTLKNRHSLTIFRMGFFGATQGWKAPLSKICHTYPTSMKLGKVIPYLRKIEKICASRDTPHCITMFSQEIGKFCYIRKYRLQTQNLRIILVNMVTILMMPAKLATLGLLKVKLFWNNSYDVIFSEYDVTKEILLRDQIVL